MDYPQNCPKCNQSRIEQGINKKILMIYEYTDQNGDPNYECRMCNHKWNDKEDLDIVSILHKIDNRKKWSKNHVEFIQEIAEKLGMIDDIANYIQIYKDLDVFPQIFEISYEEIKPILINWFYKNYRKQVEIWERED